MQQDIFINMSDRALIEKKEGLTSNKFDYSFNVFCLGKFESNPWYEQWRQGGGRIETVRECGIVGMGYPNEDGTNRWDIFKLFEADSLSNKQLLFKHQPVAEDDKAIAIFTPKHGQIGWLSKAVAHWLFGFGFHNWELGVYFINVRKHTNGYDYVICEIRLRSPDLATLPEEFRAYGKEQKENDLDAMNAVAREGKDLLKLRDSLWGERPLLYAPELGISGRIDDEAAEKQYDMPHYAFRVAKESKNISRMRAIILKEQEQIVTVGHYPTADYYIELARAYEENGNIEEAIKVLSEFKAIHDRITENCKNKNVPEPPYINISKYNKNRVYLNKLKKMLGS